MSDKGKKGASQADSLEQILKSRDDSEKLQSKLDDAVKELGEKKALLEQSLKKQEDATKQLNDLTAEYGKLKIILDKDKELKDSLSTQLNEIKNKTQEVEEEARAFKKAALAKDEILITKDRQLADKDSVISSKDEEIKRLSAQIGEGSAKIPALQDQILALQKQNEDLKLKEEKLNAQLHDTNDKLEKLRVKFRDSGDSVLGATMEVEKLKAELKQKDEQIASLSGRLGSILTGGSGVITDKDKLAELFQTMIPKTQRSIRFCVPTISSIETLGLLPIIKGFPRTAVVNISGDIKATDEHIVMDLKQKGVIFTQYDPKDRWVLNRDGEEVIIALEKSDGTVIGFFSNEQRIVSILNTTIMEPWIKGIKI
ncbi:MAG: hypothetical protein JW839_02015 [Candidatus Lokiarchaeota archaeon]|nr:hypothetical protein [Candidatus Lokiarchaeota archaeon]